MQQILNVITPASTYDLVTLAEMRMKLGITDPSNTSHDALIQELITNVSETIAKMCNRVFAYEEVEETFYQLEDGCSRRLYLSRWPVSLADIKTLTQDGNDLLATAGTQWVLEYMTGSLYMLPTYGFWSGVIEGDYSGGYKVPDETPGTLKFAVEAVIREGYAAYIRDPAMLGVRQLSHKEARVAYYGPEQFPTLGLPQTWKTVESLCQKYIRHWV